MASDLVCDKFDTLYASVPIGFASVRDSREVSLDNHIRSLLLPSDFRALLMALFYKAIYNI